MPIIVFFFIIDIVKYSASEFTPQASAFEKPFSQFPFFKLGFSSPTSHTLLLSHQFSKSACQTRSSPVLKLCLSYLAFRMTYSSLDTMAANTADRTLPTLPNDILMMIVRSFQWTEDIDGLRFLWENLRKVSPMFEEIVRKDFAARNIPNLPELLSLLPISRLFLGTYGPDGKFFL